MRELTSNETQVIGGAGGWSLNGYGGNNGKFSYGKFEFGNLGHQGANVAIKTEVVRANGKTYWGDREIMVGFTHKW